ncbi:MAG: hypothetical protein HQK84_04140 [Nitrospinae bacterium]|nr:hypothetical protein [Nitrospinota bacterium]
MNRISLTFCATLLFILVSGCSNHENKAETKIENSQVGGSITTTTGSSSSSQSTDAKVDATVTVPMK